MAKLAELINTLDAEFKIFKFGRVPAFITVSAPRDKSVNLRRYSCISGDLIR